MVVSSALQAADLAQIIWGLITDQLLFFSLEINARLNLLSDLG